jgi:ribosomal protein S24E
VKKYILVSFLTISTFTLHAQETTSPNRDSKEAKREDKRDRISAMIKQEEEGVLVYTKQSVFGLQIRTNGYGLFYELGRAKKHQKKPIFILLN